MGIFSRGAQPKTEEIALESSTDTSVTDTNTDGDLAIENLQPEQTAEQQVEQGTEAPTQEEGAAVTQEADQVPTNEAPEAPAQEADAAPTAEALAEPTAEAPADAAVSQEQVEQNAEQVENAAPVQQDAASEGEKEGGDRAPNQSAEDGAATEALAEATVVAYVRSNANKAFGLLAQGIQTTSLTRKSNELRQSLRDARLVQSLSQAARESNLSNGMVTAFQAIPEFNALVQSFPSADTFNVMVERANSTNNVAGLESFSAATISATESMKDRARDVTASFGAMLSSIPAVVTTLRAQIEADTAALEASDITAEVLADLPVMSLDAVVFDSFLSDLEANAKGIESFNADDLQAHPEKVADELTGLESLVSDLGPALGLAMDSYGLREIDRDASFQPTQGTFGAKDLTAPGINLMLSRSSAILDALDQVAQNKDALMTSLGEAIDATPQQLNTEEVSYGALDHVTLMNSYTMFVNRLVTESVSAVALVISTVDSVLNVDTGITE